MQTNGELREHLRKCSLARTYSQHSKSEADLAAETALKDAGPSAIPTLIHMLQETDSASNNGAAFGFEKLGSGGSEAVPQLIALYQGKTSIPAKEAVVQSLGAVGAASAAAIPLLVNGTDSQIPALRHECLVALIRIGGSPELTTPVYERFLADPIEREFAWLGLEKNKLLSTQTQTPSH